MRKLDFCLSAKTSAQISFTITVKLISTFVFATRIVQFLYFLNSKFQASNIFCGYTDRFVWDLVGNPKDPFSRVAAHMVVLPFLCVCVMVRWKFNDTQQHQYNMVHSLHKLALAIYKDF